eukprot:TRINITY_DN782_c0_g1_i1.p1 TRINITY_DN782_c0_g1~~TRINITY_DN782_c0_g1_i1.p1  ORF type:complete len:362 (+),score=147.77 TRINITY_DN782_c0_g1_i1:34-1119(+)
MSEQSTTNTMSDSASDTLGDEGTRQFHTCWKKKHITRVLVKRGWKSEATAKAEFACEEGGVCYVQKLHGCPCGASWKLVPKCYMDCIGGKVSLAKLLARNNITDIQTPTFPAYRFFKAAAVAGQINLQSKWFVKISHLNARKGVTCYQNADLADAACQVLETQRTDSGKLIRYVIQEEVPRPYLFDGKKMLLRLWAVLSVHGGTGDIWLHVSRRLRANTMQHSYTTHASAWETDVEHDTLNVFASTAEWEHYQSVWSQASGIAHRVVQCLMAHWDKKGIPPPLKQGSGLFNHLAFDFIPSRNPDGSLRPYLLEINVDPSFRNPCTETKSFAEDVVEFFYEQIHRGAPLCIPDKNFATIQVR